MKIITTSWDDGYPADFRIAELLDKYDMGGTFYVPKRNEEYEVMEEDKICDLAKNFEIGGHTLNHVRIRSTSSDFFEKEILGCYTWLEDLLGTAPVSFCFPGGAFNKPAIEFSFNSGFQLLRTTELLSTACLNSRHVLPTTIQVFKHHQFTYFKHLLKRFKFNSLWLYAQSGTKADLFKMVDFYLQQIDENGGCFHLWGHSWEIEKFNLWKDLEEILKIISGNSNFKYLPNAGLLEGINNE
jgi:peptidoglycan/xylan/chitin deacetylase (PgdA/CDA1 family)